MAAMLAMARRARSTISGLKPPPPTSSSEEASSAGVRSVGPGSVAPDAPASAVPCPPGPAVLAPPGLSEQKEPVNVDADRAAAQTAIALEATALILLSNVPGLLQDVNRPDSLLRQIDGSSIESARQCAGGRMKNKVLAAEEAIDAGVSRVIIGDARVARPISEALAGAGTHFVGSAATTSARQPW